MALLMKARLLAVVVPVAPAVTVLNVDVSRVIRRGFLVIDRSCLWGWEGLLSKLGRGWTYSGERESKRIDSGWKARVVAMRESKSITREVFMIQMITFILY